MNKIIFDSSALLAFLNKENGAEIVKPYLSDSVISTINLSEVITVLNQQLNIEIEEGKSLVKELISHVMHFDEIQAFKTSELRSLTKQYGLSLADRACLSLGIINSYPIITADKIWSKLNLGLEIIVIR